MLATERPQRKSRVRRKPLPVSPTSHGPDLRPLRRRTRLRRFQKRAWRHIVVELRSLHLVWRSFRWSLLFTAVVWIVALGVLHEFYPLQGGDETLTWDRAAYSVLMMTAFNGNLSYHPGMPLVVNVVFFALPLLGLFVIIDSIVRFTGLLFQRRLNQKEWHELLATTYRNHVIVGGLGHVGYRIVEQLLRSDSDIVVIEQQETPWVSEVMALGVPVIIGDVRKGETLQKAQVQHAHAIIAATDNDLVNIETGLNAKELAPDIKVILRIFDQTLASKIEKLYEIDYAFSTSALAAPLFAAAATTRNVVNSFVVQDKVLNTVELVVKADSRLAGRSLNSLRGEFEVTFLLLESAKGVDWNPDPTHELVAGEKVWVVTTIECLTELEHLNHGKRLFPFG